MFEEISELEVTAFGLLLLKKKHGLEVDVRILPVLP
jgi:hypothetical protein